MKINNTKESSYHSSFPTFDQVTPTFGLPEIPETENLEEAFRISCLEDSPENANGEFTRMESTILAHECVPRKTRRMAARAALRPAQNYSVWQAKKEQLQSKLDLVEAKAALEEAREWLSPSQSSSMGESLESTQVLSQKEEELPVTTYEGKAPSEIVQQRGILELPLLPLRPLEVLRNFKVPLNPKWNEMLKTFHDNTYPHLFPMQPPNRVGQFLYRMNIQEEEVTTLLDLGASHSFLTKDWIRDKDYDLVRIRPPRPVGLFSGQKNYIRYMVNCVRVNFKGHVRIWKFYVIDTAPYPAILGADAIMAWPIFFSPLDYRIFIIPELYRSRRLTRDLGGVYEYWSQKDKQIHQEARKLHQFTFYKEGGPKLPIDDTPTTSEDEAFRAENKPVPILYLSMEPEANQCIPWTENFEPMIWLHTMDGLSDRMECDEDNLLQLCTVTASGQEEKEKLQEFLDSIAPDLRNVVEEFPQLFAPPDTDPPQRPVKHYIYVSPDTVPAARRAYPLGDVKKDAMFSQMRELIDKGWVTPSASPWAAPILFVPKDEGTKLRMCVDFRDLNALTKKDAFPLPRLDILLHKAARAKIFSKLDLASGFHQIEVFPPHRELTAFILPEAIDGSSLWEWKVMPFGLVNAPSTFQRAMSFALRGCEDFTAVYIDDILVFSKTREEHLEHLRQVFEKLQYDCYHVRLAKCQFLSEEVRFLGHTLTSDGIKAITNRQKEFEGFTPPFDSAKKVRSFLGLIMWYKAFIPHISTIAAPLFPLTSSHRKLVWTEEATMAVEALKGSCT